MENKQHSAPGRSKGKRYETKTLKTAYPFYGVGLLWLLYALFFPLYKLTHFLILALLSAAVFIGLEKFFPGRTIQVEIPEEPAETGDAQVDQMIAEGRQYLTQIRAANDNIEDPVISAQIDRLEEITQKIFFHISEHPKKAPQIRKFFNYYLPTTLKLLNAYDKMGSQGVQGENISSAMKGIEEMMNTIVLAFEKQLDNLFADVAMDISTDIMVLEGMLTQEGLTGSDFPSGK